MNVIQEIHDRLMSRASEVAASRMPLTVDDVLEILQQVSEEQASEVAEPETDSREHIARGMLDEYHTLRTNVAIQTAIWNRLTLRHGATTQVALHAYAKLQDAQAALEAQTLDIMELMGIDR